MRVLLDECVPKRLGRHLLGHDVKTVTEMGWSSKKNGELLSAMRAEGFEVLLSVDRNLRHQQNLAGKGVSIIVLIGATNRLSDLLPHVPEVLTALATIQPETIIDIGP